MSNSLHGQTIFISASLPSDYNPPEFTVDRERLGWIEDAVIATVRSVLGNGGRLVMGGHPSIVPLVALVAGEYTPVPDPEQPPRSGIPDDDAPPFNSPPIDVFQSRAHEGYLPAETSAMCEAGLIRIHWVESLNDEVFNLSKRGEPQCEASLRAMRETLVTCAKPTAMVGIGGMGDLLEEFEMFSKICSGPVYLYRSTGGAAQILADKKLQVMRTKNSIQAGTTAQSLFQSDSSIGASDWASIQRIHVVEFLTIVRNEIRHCERDYVEAFRAFRDKNFAHTRDLFREAINPPYDFLAGMVAKKLAGGN